MDGCHPPSNFQGFQKCHFSVLWIEVSNKKSTLIFNTVLCVIFFPLAVLKIFSSLLIFGNLIVIFCLVFLPGFPRDSWCVRNFNQILDFWGHCAQRFLLSALPLLHVYYAAWCCPTLPWGSVQRFLSVWGASIAPSLSSSIFSSALTNLTQYLFHFKYFSPLKSSICFC